MARNGSKSGKSDLGDLSPEQKEQFEGWLDQLGYGASVKPVEKSNPSQKPDLHGPNPQTSAVSGQGHRGGCVEYRRRVLEQTLFLHASGANSYSAPPTS